MMPHILFSMFVFVLMYQLLVMYYMYMCLLLVRLMSDIDLVGYTGM